MDLEESFQRWISTLQPEGNASTGLVERLSVHSSVALTGINQPSQPSSMFLPRECFGR